jgi:hypothetical protein
MSLLAISTGAAILAWIGLALGLVIALVVVALFNRIVRPAQEIDRYASDILEGGVGIAKNLDDMDQLERTLELGGAVPGLATRYLEKVKGGA